MRLRRIAAWLLSAALLTQAVYIQPVLAEPAGEETISVGSEEAVEAEEDMSEESSVSGNSPAFEEVSLHVGNSAVATALDGMEEFAHRNGHIDSGVEVRNPRGLELLTGSELSSRYVSPHVTSVRNQSRYGSCWAFAGTGAIEASMVKHNGADKDTLDLSDLATAYFGLGGSYDNGGRFGKDSMTFQQNEEEYQELLEEVKQQISNYTVSGQIVDSSLGYIDAGGNSFYTIFGLAHWNGLIPENDAPYPVEDKNEDYTKAKERTESLAGDPKDGERVASLKEGLIFDMSDPVLVKNMLMQYGAVDVSYYSDNSYYSADSSSFYQNKYKGQNHEVLLVGWDDNYSKENFREECRPSDDGAWIIKNSWGTNWGTAVEDGGEKGYFYISYEDAGLSNSDANCYMVDTVDSYDHNYQYDGANIAVYYHYERRNGTYMANVYKVDNAESDEKLNAVGIFTGPDVDYTVEIYKNPDTVDGVVKNPRTGKLIGTASGREDFMGYHTVPVSCDDVLRAGDIFSVVVYQKADDNWVYVFVDVDYSLDPVYALTGTTGVPDTITFNYYGSFNTDSDSAVGQSFTTISYPDNSGWTDLTNVNPDGCNVRLKAFTTDICTLSVSQNSVSLTPGDTFSQEVTVIKGQKPEGVFTYTSSDEKVATVDASGMVTAVGAGKAVITVEAPDGAIVSYEVNVSIPMEKCTVSAIDIQQYTGGDIIPLVDVSYNGEMLIQDVDYTVSGKNNREIGTASAIITGIGRCSGSVEAPFEIKDLKLAVIPEEREYFYTGEAIKADFTVTKDGRMLEEGTDYTVHYRNNVNAGTALFTIRVAADSASVTGTFTILPANVSGVAFKQIPTQAFTGEPVTPKVEASYRGILLEEGKDYTVSYKNNEKPAYARGVDKDPQAVVSMKGNFEGEKSLPFSIENRTVGSIDLSRASVSGITSAVYTGREILQQPGVRLGRTLLTEGKDYYLTYENNVNAGKATVTINGCGEYTGKITKNFTIKSASVTSPEFTISLSDYAFAYQQGTEIKPDVVFKDSQGRNIPKSDYTVTYKNNRKTGVAKAVVKAVSKSRGGSGNLKGSRTLCFVIAENASLLSLADIEKSYTYTGAAIKPDITSLLGEDGTSYAIGREWKVKYYDNKNAGEALVILTGKGENKGKTGVCHFTIAKQTASALTIAQIKPQKFKGKALCPKVKVKNGKKSLKAGTDYVAYYYDNTSTGTGSVTLKFCGNYEGEKDVSFSIN